ncbi:unnamed protein product [Blepharisma stoltei]|uniref:Uncharacterized protein n=1 Tax=Blepharisma stoltei TaxID=1481888 RepID=A0AAU9J6Q4_9CILI|nr:unnamed protein product [Blepharisma stoltei]
MKKLERENLKRTKAEREIDKYISKDATAIKIQVCEEKKIEKPAQITPDKALEKIKKHLRNEHTYKKSINLLSKLIRKHHTKFSIEEILDCLETIYESGFINNPPQDQTKEIFRFVFENYQESIPEEKKLTFERWMFLADTINTIHTDDSYVFHKNIKFMREKLEELSEESKDWNEIYYKALLGLEKFKKIEWSKTAIQKLIEDTYEKKNIFTEAQQETLLKLRAIEPKRAVESERIRDILDAPKEITDNRDEVIIVNGLDSWSLRQAGV